MKSALLFLSLLLPAMLCGQTLIDENFRPGDSSQVHLVKLLKGRKVHHGLVETMSADRLLVRTEDGRHWEFPLNIVKSIKVKTPRYLTGKWQPQAEQVMFAPAAAGLQKGEWQYRNTLLLRQSLDYGLSEHWSFGTSLTPGWYLNEANIRVKYSLPLLKKWKLGAGMQVFGLRIIQQDGDHWQYLGTVPGWFVALGTGDARQSFNASYNRLLDVRGERLEVLAAHFCVQAGVSSSFYVEGVKMWGPMPFKGIGGIMGLSWLGKNRRWSLGLGAFGREKPGKNEWLPIPAGVLRVSY